MKNKCEWKKKIFIIKCNLCYFQFFTRYDKVLNSQEISLNRENNNNNNEHLYLVNVCVHYV